MGASKIAKDVRGLMAPQNNQSCAKCTCKPGCSLCGGFRAEQDNGRITVITAESGISATASEAVATLLSGCAASEASAFLASECEAGALHGSNRNS